MNGIFRLSTLLKNINLAVWEIFAVANLWSLWPLTLQHSLVTLLFSDDDNLSISSFGSDTSDNASLRDLEDGYSPVNRPDVNDTGYSTVNHGYVAGDIIEDLQYAESRTFIEPESPPATPLTDTTDTALEPDEGIPDEGISEPDIETDSSEEVISSEVAARKMNSYREALESQDWEALDRKLSNTNNYDTAKKVAAMARDIHGKDSFPFQIAQNRVAELKADQLMRDLDGMHLSADLGQIRADAKTTLDNVEHYSQGFRNKVMEHLDKELVKFSDYQSETEEILNRPPVPERTDDMLELEEEVPPPPPPRREQKEEAPSLPPRPKSQQSTETPLTSKPKKRNALAQLFKRR